MSDRSVFSPRAYVKAGNREWEVSELAWPDALELFRRLGDFFEGLLDPEGQPRPAREWAPILIERGGHAVAFLVQRAAQVSPEEFERLPVSLVVRLVHAALELTLNEEVLAAGNGVAGRLRRAFGLPTAPPSSSISSSIKATASTT